MTSGAAREVKETRDMRSLVRELRFCLDSGAKLAVASGLPAGWALYFLEALGNELPSEDEQRVFQVIFDALEAKVVDGEW